MTAFYKFQPPSPRPSLTRGSEHPGNPRVVLLGRPNSGKSSLFNRLTGGDAHVGNFPGITVDVMEGTAPLPSGTIATIVDLPGLYSLDAVVDEATDEGVARRFIANIGASTAPLLLVQVLNATQLALGLRLTKELRSRATRLLVVATQTDELEEEGLALDEQSLSKAIGSPVVAINCRSEASRGIVLQAIQQAFSAPFPESNTERLSANAGFDIDSIVRTALRNRSKTAFEPKRLSRTERADALLLHPIAGPILFLGFMAILFAAVFLISDPITTFLDRFTRIVGIGIATLLGEGVLASFLRDGILGGAGTVLSFMPQIVVLTLAMELLDATGYLARGAFLVDRALRAMGLTGRSFVPLLMGHACAVPAIQATRVVRDPQERLTTILVLPLMTCSARIPTFALVISAFFDHASPLAKSTIFVSLYFAGILAGLIASLALRRTVTKGKGLPLILEMPAYRTPQISVMARKAFLAASRFTRDVGTTIVAVSAILWVLLSVPLPGASSPPGTAGIENSIAAHVGRTLEPVTAPLGFDWRINVGLIGSFGAREVMVGTMGVINGIENAADAPDSLADRLRRARTPTGQPLYDVPAAFALLAFFSIACQCMSTVAAIRRETRSWKWPAFTLVYTYVAAYLAAFLTHEVARWLVHGKAWP